MTRNAYTLDGIPLTDENLDYFVDKASGIRIMPAKRAVSLQYPGFDGEAWMAGLTYDPGAVSIIMRVYGTDHQSFMQNLEFIRGLFTQRYKKLKLVHHYAEDGSDNRVAIVQFNESHETPVLPGASSGTAEFIGTVSSTFWRSETTFTDVVPIVTTATSESSLPSLSGSNAPITDALIRVKGGFSELTIGDAVSGHTIRIATTLTSTEYIVIDTSAWTARKVTTDTWSGGTVVDTVCTPSRGAGPMLTFEPALMGPGSFAYRITTAGANLTGSPQVEVRAKKSYL